MYIYFPTVQKTLGLSKGNSLNADKHVSDHRVDCFQKHETLYIHYNRSCCNHYYNSNLVHRTGIDYLGLWLYPLRRLAQYWGRLPQHDEHIKDDGKFIQ